MAESLREHECPNCGAPLGIPHKHERFFKCQFCGTVLEDRASEEEQQTGVFKIRITSEDIAAAKAETAPVYAGIDEAVIDTRAVGRTARRAGCIAAAVLLGFFLVIGGLIAAPFLIGGGTLSGFLEAVGLEEAAAGLPEGGSELGGLQIWSYGIVAQVPSDNDTAPDLVAVGRMSDETTRLMYLDLEKAPQLRWMVPVEEDAASHLNRFIASDALLFSSYGPKVAAYNLLDGTPVWEAALSDQVQHSYCRDCFQLIGGALLALSDDGVLASLNPGTGESLWREQLEETPRQIIDFGGRPAVLDGSGDTRLRIFEPTSGQEADAIVPQCPSDPFPTQPQTPGIYDLVTASRDHQSIYFLAGFFEPGCLQRWDARSGQMIWQATFPVAYSRSVRAEQVLLTEQHFILAGENGVFVIAIQDGQFRELVLNEDFHFLPLGFRDGVLAVLAERQRGSRLYEIWGVDIELGNVKWTFVPQNASLIESDSTALTSSAGWTAGLTPGGVSVAIFPAGASQVLVQTIPLESGTASTPVRAALDAAAGASWVRPIGWRSNQLWFAADPDIFIVDVDTGEVLQQWP